MAPQAHAKLGASSMHRWAACPGSIREQEGCPDNTSYYAAEGTVAHELAESCLRIAEKSGKPYPARHKIGEKWFKEGHEITVDEEMADAVQLYLDAIESATEEGDQTFIEHKFDLSLIYDGLFGTNDFCLYRPSEKLLWIWDYKHGAGVSVEAEGNQQMQYYGLGAAISRQNMPISKIRLTICQPRAHHKDGPIRSWEMKPMDLLKFREDLVRAAKATEDPNAPIHPGSHCKFCRAQPKCPALIQKAQDAAKEAFAGGLPQDLSPDRVAEILSDADTVEAWIRAVREYAHRRLEMGSEVPGWKLVQKRAQRKWDDANIGMLSSFLHDRKGLTDDDIYAPKKLKTPAQLEKLLPKDDRKQLEPFIVTSSSGTTLVRDGDPRKSAAPSADQAFTKIT